MRPGILLSALLLAGPALAQDARIAFLSKQLANTSSDPRTRAQTALILGKSNNPAAVAPLCSALKDAEPVVRSAVAGALGELQQPDGIPCLKRVANDPDGNVRAAIARALEALAASPTHRGGLYVAIEPVNDKGGGLTPDVLKLAEGLIREKVASMGATLAPSGESKQAASSVITKAQMKGYLLRANLTAGDDRGLKLEVLVMTYPDLALQGTWNIKARGAKPEALLKKMVPVVVDNAANELEWKQ